MKEKTSEPGSFILHIISQSYLICPYNSFPDLFSSSQIEDAKKGEWTHCVDSVSDCFPRFTETTTKYIAEKMIAAIRIM